MKTTLLWFRQDLRLHDQPALTEAVRAGGPVLPVFVWSPEEEGKWAPGAASRVWLHHSLAALDAGLRKRGSKLILRSGPAAETLLELCRQTGATKVCFGFRYEPAARAQELRVRRLLAQAGIEVAERNTALLHAPGSIQTGEGRPYRVFTPFSRTCLEAQAPPHPHRAPRSIPEPRRWPHSLRLPELALQPGVDWAAGLRAHWRPGEAGARARLRSFLAKKAMTYEEDRDRPDRDGTSLLSPHLHFGEISAGAVWHEVGVWAAAEKRPGLVRAAEAYLRQLLWREFAYHLLYHFPETAESPLRSQFAHFPWSRSRKNLEVWKQGRTGYPLVDAGMRQLLYSGWMHNRVRMVAASFLVKDLLISWQEGARWFWDTLVDADLANNTLGWQWCAGCGADAAPYFRIFHPTRQSERFDPDGEYIRRWIPELQSSAQGEPYPGPLVDHALARRRALAALSSLGKK